MRLSASLHYSVPVSGGSWSSSFIWGRNHRTGAEYGTNAFVLESVLPVRKNNLLTGRAELVDKDELFTNQDLQDRPAAASGNIFRIGAYTVGYTRNIGFWRNIQTGIGANVELYSLPQAVKPFYGDHPSGERISAIQAPTPNLTGQSREFSKCFLGVTD